MEEVASELLKPIARVLLTGIRGLIWLSWDLMIETIGWSIGWLVCRTICFGYFPNERITEIDNASFLVAIVVEITGLAFLLCLAYWLSIFVGQ